MKTIIPKKLKIGYQARDDAANSRLAFITFYADETGLLRKEHSWKQWRDASLGEDDVDNTPIIGYHVSAEIQRSRGWFGSGRSLVRVTSPKGFDFEISIDNLCLLLHHTTVTNGLIDQECVFGWEKTNLVLLPTNSHAYQEATLNTQQVAAKLSAGDLIVGRQYIAKSQLGQSDPSTLCYLGFFKKKHLFAERHRYYKNCIQVMTPKIASLVDTQKDDPNAMRYINRIKDTSIAQQVKKAIRCYITEAELLDCLFNLNISFPLLFFTVTAQSPQKTETVHCAHVIFIGDHQTKNLWEWRNYGDVTELNKDVAPAIVKQNSRLALASFQDYQLLRWEIERGSRQPSGSRLEFAPDCVLNSPKIWYDVQILENGVHYVPLFPHSRNLFEVL